MLTWQGKVWLGASIQVSTLATYNLDYGLDFGPTTDLLSVLAVKGSEHYCISYMV